MYAKIGKYTPRNNYKAKPIVSGVKIDKEATEDVKNPNNGEVIGTVINADAKIAKRAMKNAHLAFEGWNATLASDRADILEKFADLLEKDTSEFIAVAMIEAGKTLSNAIDEVREAVDFVVIMQHKLELNLMGLCNCQHYLSSSSKLSLLVVELWFVLAHGISH